jgi:hypothetical protein
LINGKKRCKTAQKVLAFDGAIEYYIWARRMWRAINQLLSAPGEPVPV